MSEYKPIQELLGTGIATQGSLLIPRKIYDTLVDEYQKALIPRSEAAAYIGPAGIPGSSVDVNLVTLNLMRVREVGEGGEVPLDQTEYTSTNIRPLKYGVAIRITRELLEDAKWDLLQQNIMIAGRRFAENENSLVITQLNRAANTVSGGAAVTHANITRAMQYLEDSDAEPTTLIVGMEVLNDLRNIDTYVDYSKMGNSDFLRSGFVGNLMGMNVIKVSTNAGMTTTTAYVTDKRWAYYIVEKRPITVENVDLATYDMSGAIITQRIAVSAIRTSAIARITSS